MLIFDNSSSSVNIFLEPHHRKKKENANYWKGNGLPLVTHFLSHLFLVEYLLSDIYIYIYWIYILKKQHLKIALIKYIRFFFSHCFEAFSFHSVLHLHSSLLHFFHLFFFTSHFFLFLLGLILFKFRPSWAVSQKVNRRRKKDAWVMFLIPLPLTPCGRILAWQIDPKVFALLDLTAVLDKTQRGP